MFRSLNIFERVVNGLHPRREFFSSEPGRKPSSLPMEMVGPRDDEPGGIRGPARCVSSRQPMAHQGLPVPALAHERDELDAVVEQARRRRNAVRGCAGLMPQMPSRQSMMGTSFVPVASTLVSAAFLGFASSTSVQNSFGE